MKRFLNALWRIIRCLAWGTIFVAVHHIWFSVPSRNYLLAGVDGLVLLGLAYGLVWATGGFSHKQDSKSHAPSRSP